MAHGGLERGLADGRFGAGVDQQREFARVLHPAGHEAPAHEHRPALRQVATRLLPFPGDDDKDRLRRRDVVARRRIFHIHDAEEFPQEVRFRQQCKSSTHGAVIALCL